MSATLELEYAEDCILEVQPSTFGFLREFCTVCYTDNVSVRTDGSIFCPECGHTTARLSS